MLTNLLPILVVLIVIEASQDPFAEVLGKNTGLSQLILENNSVESEIKERFVLLILFRLPVIDALFGVLFKFVQQILLCLIVEYSNYYINSISLRKKLLRGNLSFLNQKFQSLLLNQKFLELFLSLDASLKKASN